MAWDRIRDSYDAVAGTYETRFLHELDGKPRDRELLAAFAAATTDPVIEVGCGPGQVGLELRRHERRVIGADLSPAMARLAAARLDGSVVADMRALPFATGGAGGVLAFYSLIHLRRPDVPAALRELARVLRPGGHLLLSVHEGDGELARDEFIGEPVPIVATLFDLDELVAATTAAGLDVVLAERRQPYADESTVRLYVGAQRVDPT